MSFGFEPIAIVRSPFKEKFGVPRQPGIVTAAQSSLEFLPPYDRDEALEGLAGFSHVWLLFAFHATADQVWHPTVRPPRLGGNTRVGVFASRSTFRPNPIGMSAVELVGYGRDGDKLIMQVRGADLIDGTPVLDIKPYLSYVDSIADARGGYASSAPEARLAVQFSAQAEAELQARMASAPELRELITQLLAGDPRPSYHGEAQPGRIYGMRLYDFDLRWQVVGDVAVVVGLCVPGA